MKGWVPECTDAEYFANPGISFSEMKLALQGPVVYRNSKRYPFESSAMNFGTMFHEKILFGKDPDKITPAAKRDLDAMANQIASIQFLQELLGHKDKIIEVPGFWEGQKCKPDLRIPSLKLIVDLKTTSDATPESFKWSAKKFMYHLQARHYLDVASKIDSFEYENFIFVVCEKTAPYNVFLYEVAPNILHQAVSLKEKAIQDLTTFQHDLDFLADSNQSLVSLLQW